MRAGLRLWFAIVAFTAIAAQAQPAPQAAKQPVPQYIKRSWVVLTRSPGDIAKAAPDPKFRPGPGGRWPVYVARDEDLAKVEQRLKGTLQAKDFATIEVRALPAKIEEIREQGLLYLPK